MNGNYDPSGSGINLSAASPGYTNRISISNSQFNAPVGNNLFVGVYDEGGFSHSIRDNNFNAGARAIFLVGVHEALIEGNEIERNQQEAIYIDQNAPNETWASSYVHQSHMVSIRHNTIANSTKSAVRFATPLVGGYDPFVWTASVTDNGLGSSNGNTVPALAGTAYVAGLVAYANFNGYGGVPISDVGSVVAEVHGIMSISKSPPINNATTPPVGTFYLYVDPADNKLKALGSSGTVTPLALP